MKQNTQTSDVGLATSIDQVVESLDKIIEQARQDNSRLGYFAALYRKVTVQVRDGIAAGDFENGERMEQLDVIFANRYLAAFKQHQDGQPTTRSWLFAFESAEIWQLLIIQHLLLGMNVHINLDLGIAAVQTSPEENLPALRNDFFKINDILARLLGVVQTEINTLSPGFKFLDKIGGKTDEAIMNFSINRARDEAWSFAKELALLPPEERELKIAEKDNEIEKLANLVANPGKLIKLILVVIRLFETSNVAKVIDVLF